MVLVLVDSIEAVAIGPAFPRFCVVLLGASSPIVTILVHRLGNGAHFASFDAHDPLKMNILERSAPAWIRTKDQLIKSQLLYRLSYRGMRYGRGIE